MLLIIGLGIVVAAVVGGYLMAGGAMLVLMQPAEFLIIGGAAMGSLIVSTPKSVLIAIVTQTRAVIAGAQTRGDYLELLGLLYQVFKQAQQGGFMSLESHFETPAQSALLSRFPKFLARHEAVDFLADSVKIVVVGGIAAHDLDALMDEDLKAHHDEALKPAAALTKIGDALPGLGIVAAVLGVVITMGHIDAPPAEVGAHIGAALVGTFVGILLSYGFVQPIAAALEQHVNAESCYCQCIKAGLLAAYKSSPPAIAVEFARRVLPHSVRPSFDETEQHCRASAAPKPVEAAAA